MTIEVRCACGQVVYADSRHAGQHVQCPHCKGTIAVPVATAAMAPPSDPHSAQRPAKASRTGSGGGLWSVLGVFAFLVIMSQMRSCKDQMAADRRQPRPVQERSR